MLIRKIINDWEVVVNITSFDHNGILAPIRQFSVICGSIRANHFAEKGIAACRGSAEHDTNPVPTVAEVFGIGTQRKTSAKVLDLHCGGQGTERAQGQHCH